MRNNAVRPVLLVTGFGPFPGVPFNISAVLCENIATIMKNYRAELHSVVLPTHWRDGPAIAAAKIREMKPDAVVHFGVSRAAGGFQFETRAYNQCAVTADCTGKSAQSFYFRRGGPPLLQATLPVTSLIRRLRLRGLPAQISRDAGRYLCNATLYNSLHEAHLTPEHARPLVGFVHIPALPAASMYETSGHFGWAHLQRGAVELLHGLIRSLRKRAYATGHRRSNRINISSI